MVFSTLSPIKLTSVLLAGNSIFSLYTPFLIYSVIGANGNTRMASIASCIYLKSPEPSLATVNTYLYCCGLLVCVYAVKNNPQKTSREISLSFNVYDLCIRNDL